MNTKFLTVKSILENLLVAGAVIKIGPNYAEHNPHFKAWQIISLVTGQFELDDGFGTVQSAPAIWNEEKKEFDSIYHLFENDLSMILDCQILDDRTERTKGHMVVDTNTSQIPFRVYSEATQSNVGYFMNESDAELFAAAVNRVNWDQNTFQQAVHEWMIKCFGEVITMDKVERNHRWLEEALETAQSLNCSKKEALDLVEYVWSRPIGEPKQEVGGAMVTLAALAIASGLDIYQCALTELARINIPEVMKKIREKQAKKPKFSALPQ